MTRAKDISKIITDADFSGTLDVTGTAVVGGLDVQGDGTISGGSRLTISDIADENNDGIRLDDNTTSRYNNLTQDTSGNFKIQHYTGSAWQNNLTVTTTGNVGIGTSSPSGAAGTTLAINGGSGQSRLALKNTSTGDASGDGFQLSVGTDGSVGIEQRENNYMSLYTNATERMRIDSSGNVGIGTTSPGSKLDVATGANGAIFRYDTASTFLQILPEDANGDISLRYRANSGSAPDLLFKNDGGTEHMRITNGGNVGIGASSPNARTEITTSSGENLRLTKATGAYLGFHDGTATRAAFQGINGADGLSIHTGSSVTERMRIDSSGNVGIGTSSPHKRLTVGDSDATAYISAGANNTHLTLASIGSGGAVIFKTGGTNGDATTTTERMRVTNNGNVLIGLTSSNTSSEALQSYRNGAAAISAARQQDGTIVNFRTGSVNGAVHGSVSISGVTCSYNAFSGSHWSRLSDNSKPTILKGTIIETIDEMCDWYRAEFTVPATGEDDEYVRSEPIELPNGKSEGDTITYTYEETDYTATIVKEGDEKHVKCKISDTADSKKVYGVYSTWDADDDTVNDMYVTAVGTHVVRINKDVTVSAGDLLSSNGDGTAKVQDDDIIRSKTIGKVLTNIVQETYDDGSYTVPCALYCG